MPLFRLETNVPRSKITPEFLNLTREVLSKTLGREIENCHVEVIPDLLIAWDDSPAPAGNASLLCVGYLSPESNIRHAAALSEHLFEHLGIASDRVLIEFNDVKDTYLGWSGSTVADIFKK